MEDEKIIALYWQREESAISVTAEKYEPYCTAIAHSILRSLRACFFREKSCGRSHLSVDNNMMYAIISI